MKNLLLSAALCAFATPTVAGDLSNADLDRLSYNFTYVKTLAERCGRETTTLLQRGFEAIMLEGVSLEDLADTRARVDQDIQDNLVKFDEIWLCGAHINKVDDMFNNEFLQ